MSSNIVEKELSKLDDFVINSLIARGLQQSIDAGFTPPSEDILRAAHVVWRRRYPNHLAPCYAGMKFPKCYKGIREVYVWPEA